MKDQCRQPGHTGAILEHLVVEFGKSFDIATQRRAGSDKADIAYGHIYVAIGRRDHACGIGPGNKQAFGHLEFF